LNKDVDLADELRLQIQGGLHIGLLKPGSKLPSIREVADRRRIDHRAVARAYAQLEADRLVEVRGRSGVYVSPVAAASTPLSERDAWLASVLHAAWSRGVTMAELHHDVRRTTLHRLRCVCIESTRDHLIGFSSELAAHFGFSVIPICFRPQRDGSVDPVDHARMEAEACAADLIATTSFHAPVVEELGRRTAKRVLSITINPDIRDEVAKVIASGPVRIVVADPAFVERARAFLKTIKDGHNMELVLADDMRRAVPDDKRTVYTKAARRELGLPEFHLVAENVPFISAESAAAICKAIVQLTG
jgi:DNA-binding transcriptional regulator YhcF (GntR family)